MYSGGEFVNRALRLAFWCGCLRIAEVKGVVLLHPSSGTMVCCWSDTIPPEEAKNHIGENASVQEAMNEAQEIARSSADSAVPVEAKYILALAIGPPTNS
jgi:hypothetical protein